MPNTDNNVIDITWITSILTIISTIYVFSLTNHLPILNAYSQMAPPFFHQEAGQPGNQTSSEFEFKFVAVGDWDCDADTMNTVNSIKQKNPDLILALGDFSYENTANCWLNLVDPIDEKMKIVIGNHETRINDAQGYKVDAPQLLNQYMTHFNLTNQYYSFNERKMHFLILSTETEYDKDSEQFRFAVDDLSKAATDPMSEWIVVAYHRHITYNSQTGAGDYGSESFRDTYHPLFDKYGVDLVLMGHQHNYERTYSLRYNTDSPASPIITDKNVSYYNDPKGQIFAIVGTGGTSLDGFDGQAPNSTAHRYQGFGLAEIKVTKNPSVLNFTFFSQDGTTEDNFIITRLRPEKVGQMQASQTLSEVTTIELNNESSTGFYKYTPFVSFSGNNYIDVKHNDSLSLTQFTLSTWFRTGEGIPSNATRQYLVNKGGTGSDSPGKNMNYGIYLRDEDATLRGGFEGVNGSHNTVASSTPVNDSQWHYVAITFDGSDLIMYLDGVQIDIEDKQGIPDSTGILPLRIGANANNEKYHFAGDIDEVRIWNRALSANEVKEAYEEGSFNTEGQVLHLPFSNASSTFNRILP